MKKGCFLIFLFLIISISTLNVLLGFNLDNKINDWKLNERESFRPDNLYDHIDGDADSFLSFNFKYLDVFYYSRDNRELVVEIYNMGNALNALGVFRARMGREECNRKYGVESVVTENEIVFVKGAYYVKMYVYDVWEGVEKALDSVAGEIERKISAPSGYPREFSLFPEKHLIPCSFAYYPENYMNVNEFNRVFEALYKIGRRKIKLFYTEGTYPGKLEDAGKIMGLRIQKAVLPSGKELYIVKRGKFLWGSDSMEGIYIILRNNSLK